MGNAAMVVPEADLVAARRAARGAEAMAAVVQQAARRVVHLGYGNKAWICDVAVVLDVPLDDLKGWIRVSGRLHLGLVRMDLVEALDEAGRAKMLQSATTYMTSGLWHLIRPE